MRRIIRRSPLFRVSLSLVLLTVSILLIGDLFFRVGTQSADGVLDARKKLCELLAVQSSILIERKDIEGIETTLNAAVRRNADVLSAALRAADGNIMVEAGVHARYWVDIPFGKSTPTHAQVPIYDGGQHWGSIEVRFTSLGMKGFWAMMSNPFGHLILFVAVMGFAGYLFFMKRTLKHLDPGAVLPGRVKTALNVLAEGVVLIDQQSEIVLANEAFARKIGQPAQSLLGRKLSEMTWKTDAKRCKETDLPWVEAMASGNGRMGVQLNLLTATEGARTFMVNSSPILDDDGAPRGVMATFDDVTELEKRNDELQNAINALQQSQEEVNRQNEKLQILATRDPLTSCLNRRSLYEFGALEFEIATRDSNPLACIMMDIDHFKSVNDSFGHAVGDAVLQRLADTLRSGVRTIDLIGRYGGEEFCILLPGLDLGQASIVAERLRKTIAAEVGSGIKLDAELIVTSSFGISSTELGAADTHKLVDQADKALYASKHNGRNRVTRADELDEKQLAFG